MNPGTHPPASSDAPSCSRCDGPGGAITFSNQACLPINGRVQCIDWCIHQLVAALNAGGIETVASCCGHGAQRGRIDLRDGRVLWIDTPVTTPAAVTEKPKFPARAPNAESSREAESTQTTNEKQKT